METKPAHSPDRAATVSLAAVKDGLAEAFSEMYHLAYDPRWEAPGWQCCDGHSAEAAARFCPECGSPRPDNAPALPVLTWRPRPPAAGMCFSDFAAALPAPGTDGHAREDEVASAILRTIGERADNRYQGRQVLARVRAALAREDEPDPGSENPDPGMAYRPRCMYCGEPIPAGRGPLAKYCRNSHKVAAHKRKVARERQAAERGT